MYTRGCEIAWEGRRRRSCRHEVEPRRVDVDERSSGRPQVEKPCRRRGAAEYRACGDEHALSEALREPLFMKSTGGAPGV